MPIRAGAGVRFGVMSSAAAVGTLGMHGSFFRRKALIPVLDEGGPGCALWTMEGEPVDEIILLLERDVHVGGWAQIFAECDELVDRGPVAAIEVAAALAFIEDLGDRLAVFAQGSVESIAVASAMFFVSGEGVVLEGPYVLGGDSEYRWVGHV